MKHLTGRPSKASARFDYTWLLKLHSKMFGDVWEWAGQERKKNLSIGVPWPQIIEGTMAFVKDIEYRREEKIEPSTVAVWIHHRAVEIHPFENGNGRWSRMLANIFLKQEGCGVIGWPETDLVDHASSIRQEYLEAVREGDQGRLGPLQDLHARYSEEVS